MSTIPTLTEPKQQPAEPTADGPAVLAEALEALEGEVLL